MTKSIILLICFYIVTMSLVIGAREPNNVDATFFYKPIGNPNIVNNGIVYAFTRPFNDENGLTVVNFSASQQTALINLASSGLQFAGGFNASSMYYVNDLYADTSRQVLGSSLLNFTVTLPLYGSAVYVISTEVEHV